MSGAAGLPIATLLAGFAISAICGVAVVQAMRRLQFRQHAYADAPQTHQVKTGTPTMGGIVFIVAIACMWFALRSLPFVSELCLLVIACSGIGFIDDFLAIRAKDNRGLRARTKFLATALVAIVFLRMIDALPAIFPRDVLFHTATYALVVPHWLWLLLGICAITGSIHAVNLTDGLDGLATGTIVPPLAVLALVAAQTPMPAAAALATTGIGACFGFLVYNRYPAKIFMGDTGSLALGALLSGVAILSGEMLLLLVVGGVFVAEALSVMIQVTYFKISGGKRVFRMTPLHHHFELAGWPETKVTARFWLASFLCSLVGAAVVR